MQKKLNRTIGTKINNVPGKSKQVRTVWKEIDYFSEERRI